MSVCVSSCCFPALTTFLAPVEYWLSALFQIAPAEEVGATPQRRVTIAGPPEAQFKVLYLTAVI